MVNFKWKYTLGKTTGTIKNGQVNKDKAICIIAVEAFSSYDM